MAAGSARESRWAAAGSFGGGHAPMRTRLGPNEVSEAPNRGAGSSPTVCTASQPSSSPKTSAAPMGPSSSLKPPNATTRPLCGAAAALPNAAAAWKLRRRRASAHASAKRYEAGDAGRQGERWGSIPADARAGGGAVAPVARRGSLFPRRGCDVQPHARPGCARHCGQCRRGHAPCPGRVGGGSRPHVGAQLSRPPRAFSPPLERPFSHQIWDHLVLVLVFALVLILALVLALTPVRSATATTVAAVGLAAVSPPAARSRALCNPVVDQPEAEHPRPGLGLGIPTETHACAAPSGGVERGGVGGSGTWAVPQCGEIIREEWHLRTAPAASLRRRSAGEEGTPSHPDRRTAVHKDMRLPAHAPLAPLRRQRRPKLFLA